MFAGYRFPFLLGLTATLLATSGAPAAETSAGPSQSFRFPASARMRYVLSGEVARTAYQAPLLLHWHQDGATYDARLEIPATATTPGSLVQRSSGRIAADGLAPTRFVDRGRNGLTVHFDRERQRVLFSANAPELALTPGTQDRLSVAFHLAAMLAGSPGTHPAGSRIALQTVGPRDAEWWLLSVEGTESLALPAGRVQAVKLMRRTRRPSESNVEFWFAPALAYLPVRIKTTQPQGDFVDQQLQGLDKP